MALSVVKLIKSGAVNLPDNDQYTNRFEIKSQTSNRKYIIAQHKTSRWWACSCPGWIRTRSCKHLIACGLPTHQVPMELGYTLIELILCLVLLGVGLAVVGGIIALAIHFFK
jgi:prepilin-type N-terminal cleavage/methylation domain-containing protein